MKKMAWNILFICLCVVVFIGFAIIGALLGIRHLTNARYSYLKVDFTENVGTVVKDLSYGSDPLQNYDLYLPADQSREKYSFILFVHGGGFTGGDKSLVEAVRYGEYLASKGYVVASANYRLAAEGNGVSVGDMVEDLISAVEVSIDKAEELGYHVTEMATTGGSAGGCLAMLVAFKEPDRLPVPIRLVFEETGPASFEPELWDVDTDEAKAAFVNTVSGKSFTAADVGSAEFQNAINEISAATMIDENTPPILLAYGPNDKMVNPKAKVPLLEALERCGVEHTYIEFPNSGHGLMADPDKTAEWFRVMEEYLSRFFENN
jgi:acetyl esterase/lipase